MWYQACSTSLVGMQAASVKRLNHTKPTRKKKTKDSRQIPARLPYDRFTKVPEHLLPQSTTYRFAILSAFESFTDLGKPVFEEPAAGPVGTQRLSLLHRFQLHMLLLEEYINASQAKADRRILIQPIRNDKEIKKSQPQADRVALPEPNKNLAHRSLHLGRLVIHVPGSHKTCTQPTPPNITRFPIHLQ